jgi:hypothetical protein
LNTEKTQCDRLLMRVLKLRRAADMLIALQDSMAKLEGMTEAQLIDLENKVDAAGALVDAANTDPDVVN